VFDHQRCGPRRLLVPRDFPALLPGELVEGIEEGTAFVIPVHDQRVTVKYGRTAFAMRVQRLHLPEIQLPFHSAVGIEAIKSARTEEGVDELSVRHWRIGCRTARIVPTLVRPFLAHDFLP
jgi:hypothetical protein